jgi:hypothetical protein
MGQHTGFNGLVSHVKSEKCVARDPLLTDYLETSLEWFILLKDVRDYLACFGAVHFSIKESESNTLFIEIFSGIDVNYFTSTTYSGFE